MGKWNPNPLGWGNVLLFVNSISPGTLSILLRNAVRDERDYTKEPKFISTFQY